MRNGSDQPALGSGDCLGDFVGCPCLSCDALNKGCLAVGVADMVVGVRGRQLNFETFIATGGLRMCNEVITKQKALPVLLECPPTSHYVDVVCTDTRVVAPDEERIPRRDVVAEARTPKVVVALRREDGRNLGSGGTEAGHLDQHVHNRLGGESRNGGAAEVFDAAN